MSMLKVAGVQMDISFEAPEENYKSVEQLARQAADQGVDLLVLPEMFATGFSMNKEILTPESNGNTMTFLMELSANLKMNILGGVVQHRSAQVASNMAVVVDRNGQVVHEYAKNRLFTPGGEAELLTPGKKVPVCEIEGVRIASFVCYDLRFPELFRKVAREVDMAIVIASWPQSRLSHWNCLLQARSIENQQYVVGVNRIGEGGGISYNGGTTIIDPNGVVLDAQLDNEALVMSDIDTEVVADVRRGFPFLKDMS